MTKRREMSVCFIMCVSLILSSTIILTDCNSHNPPRSRNQRALFMRSHPCPANGRRSGACPGYVVDHVIPLECGGADRPENMNWQSIEEGKAKDKWERKGCLNGKRVKEEPKEEREEEDEDK